MSNFVRDDLLAFQIRAYKWQLHTSMNRIYHFMQIITGAQSY